MSYEYAQKRRGISAPGNGNEAGVRARERTIPNSMRLDALKSGAAQPTAEEKGHQIDLQAAIRAKMESSFGADFSSVKLYESQAVADAGAEAVAQGNEIAFAPGKADFSSQSGQALLGHELSHVASQSRGEVTGVGFLADSGLEAQADREGAMAARGESLYGGAVAPLSSASPAAMAGPMQARKQRQPQAQQPQQPQEVQPQQAPEEQPQNEGTGTYLDQIYERAGVAEGYGAGVQANTVFGNMRSWGAGLGTVVNPFKTAHLHKDWMTKSRKAKVQAREDAEMKALNKDADKLFNDEDFDEEDWDV